MIASSCQRKCQNAVICLLAWIVVSPHVAAVRAQTAAAPRVSEERFKLNSVGTGLIHFHDSHRLLPPPRDKMGTVDGPRLSWRVHLLPYLGEPDLYEEFHFDEPWDSPHNLRLLPLMPDVLRLGGETGANTRFRVFAGAGSLFHLQNEDPLRAAGDGLAHTILVMIVPPEQATPWTKPDEYDLALGGVESLAGRELICYMANGQQLRLGAELEPEALRALATPNGREVVDADALRRRYESAAPSTAASGNNKARPNAPQRETVEKIKTVVLAMHNYHDTHRAFPVSGKKEYLDSNGEPHLSWRVHILPYLEQDALYRRFRLDQPWDSPHNRELIPLMPEVFRDPAAPADATTTRLVVIRGNFATFKSGPAPRFAHMRDGTSRTILVVQCGADRAVPWTKPDDVYFDPTRPLECLGAIDPAGFGIGFADGACHWLKASTPAALFAPLVTPSGGEVINDQDLRAHLINP